MKLRVNRRIGLVVAAVAVLGAAYFKWQTVQATHQAQDLEQRTTNATARRQALGDELRKLQAISQSTAKRPVAKKQNNKPPAKSFLAALQTDPVVQNLYLKHERGGLHMRYAALYAKLHLTPDQIAKFEDNEMASTERKTDLQSAMVAQHLSGLDPAAQAMRAQDNAEYDQAQMALLGSDGLQALHQFKREFAPRDMVANFSASALLNDQPLTADQTAQLNATLIAAFHSPTDAEFQNVDWDAVDRQAAAFLTPQQLDIFQHGEIIGPFGVGSRFLSQLNLLITKDDEADHAAAKPSP